MKFKEIKTLEDFQQLKVGDVIACEFHRDVHQGINKRLRFGAFTIELIQGTEIIFNRKWNNYFNYALFLDPKESSNLKECYLIDPSVLTPKE